MTGRPATDAGATGRARAARLARLAAFAAAYYALCRLGDTFSRHQSSFATFWPVAGLLAGALVVARRRERVPLALAALAADLLASGAAGRSPWLAAANAGVDLLEGGLAAALVARREGGLRRPIDGVAGLARLLLLAALAAPVIPALLGAWAALARYGLATDRLPHLWAGWWAGDALGVLVVAPAVIAWSEARWVRPRPRTVAEAAALGLALAAASGLVFGGGVHLERSYLLLPPLAWAALRFEVRGASASAAALALLAAAWTSREAAHGAAVDPFAATSVQLHLLLAVSAATALVLGAALAERARAERDLGVARERAQAAERLAALGALTAGVAHEIANPLTYVTASLAAARETLGPLAADPRAREALAALDDASDGTRRVVEVVADLRAGSRMPALAPAARRPVDLRGEVEVALRLARHQLAPRAHLALRLDPAPPVSAGEFQLGQVAVNLVVNAAHAVPEGRRGQVRVSTSTGPDGWAELEVADDGVGMTPEVAARAFDPFFTTKPPGQGTGLGLSVCRGIVEALGGTIAVETAPGRGATFRVRLPPAPA